MSQLYQVTAPHFCAGIEVLGGKVVEAAPILAWTKGKQLAWLTQYCERKGWKIAEVTPHE